MPLVQCLSKDSVGTWGHSTCQLEAVVASTPGWKLREVQKLPCNSFEQVTEA